MSENGSNPRLVQEEGEEAAEFPSRKAGRSPTSRQNGLLTIDTTSSSFVTASAGDGSWSPSLSPSPNSGSASAGQNDTRAHLVSASAKSGSRSSSLSSSPNGSAATAASTRPPRSRRLQLSSSPASISSGGADFKDFRPQNGTPACDLSEEQFRSLIHKVEEKVFLHDSQAAEHCKSPQLGSDQLDDEKKFQRALIEWLAMMDSIKHVHRLKLEQKKRKRDDSSTKRAASTSATATTNKSRGSEQQEAAVKTAFNEYAEFLSNCTKKYPTSVRGGLITEGSRADISCINSRTEILFVGELKNRDKYTVQHAIRQCTAYLYHLLWWFRVVQGVDVQQVYGFCVCGPKCKGLKNENLIQFSFLKLCTPTIIGGPLKLSVDNRSYGLSTNEGDSILGFQELAQFLAHSHFTPHAAAALPERISSVPGAMMLPLSATNQTDNWYEVVKSGTAALVLKVELAELPHDDGELSDFLLRKFSLEHRSIATVLLKLIKKAKEQQELSVYIKVVNAASGKDWDIKGDFSHILNTFCFSPESKTMYGLGAYEEKSIIRCTSCTIIFMHDMGVTISKERIKSLAFDQFCAEYFSMLKKTELLLTEEVVHGDIHPGNLLYKEGTEPKNALSLIDWDECTRKKALARNVSGDRQKERYPERFLEKAAVYTKVQLLVLFRDIVGSTYGKTVSLSDDGRTQFVNHGSGSQSASAWDLSALNKNIVSVEGGPSPVSLDYSMKDLGEDEINSTYDSLKNALRTFERGIHAAVDMPPKPTLGVLPK